MIIYVSLIIVILLYFVILCFIAFNFYRIMIKQCKVTLIPLTIFYVCSTTIVITRIINNAAFFNYFYSDLTEDSTDYHIVMKTGIIASYFNIIMGFFQVASIFELFFVCGSILKAAENSELEEAKPPSVIGIAFAYLLASFASLACLGLLVYFLAFFVATFDEKYHSLGFKVSSYIVIGLCALLTLGVVLLSCRLLKLRAIQAPIVDGKRALTAYYMIFMLGYMSKVAADVALGYINDDDYWFLQEMIYDLCPIIWDGVPILSLLLFHYKNFKPGQHELIIRIKNRSD